MTKTKILFVITKSNFGGAQRYVYELATHLPKDRFEVVVACGGNGLLYTKLHTAGIKTYLIQSFERDINLKKEIQAFQELTTIIHTERPDIVHLNSSKAGGVGALAAHWCRVPKIIFTAHGWPFFERRSFFWRILVWTASWMTTFLSHAVIVVSRHDITQAHMYGLKHKLNHIYTALPPIPFLTRDEARAHLFSTDIRTTHNTDMWLVTIAEHTPNKNLLFAIDAVAEHNRTHSKKIFYTLIGDGEQTELLTKYIQTHNLASHIYLAGYREDARTMLCAFDTFLLSSTKEGFPYTLLEAGLAGIPCIASDVGGIHEIIRHNETGICFNPLHADSLRDALAVATQDTEHTHTYAKNLQKIVMNEFNITTMIEKTISLYYS